jgi:murein DD-endopeptidase MepM/ murein hydrolase activator NlpD
MRTPLPHSVRAHARGPGIVVALLLAVLLSLARPMGALGSPVDPVPVGVWPLQPGPQVVRAFDPPDTSWGKGHRGVDLAGTLGQAVGSALLGRVTFIGSVAGRGVVVVDHGATRTTYEPVTATVHVGEVVLPGQQIGTLRLSGSHCFPRACLHWGWLHGDTYLDPLLLVGGGPIVLLPLWQASPSTVSGRGSPYAEIVGRLLARSIPDLPRHWVAPVRRGSPGPVWHRPLVMRPLLM